MKVILVNACFLVVLMFVKGTCSGAVANSKGLNARAFSSAADSVLPKSWCPVTVCIDEECNIFPDDCDPNTDCRTSSCDPNGCVYDFTSCDDGKPCTDDACIGNSGCVNTNTCDDSDPCTDNVCTSSGCTFPPKPCSSDCPCNANSCNAGTGCPVNRQCSCVGLGTCECVCTSDPNCDDGDACTVDTCGDGTCVHTQIICDDSNPCTIEQGCNPLTGCVRVPAPCSDTTCPCTTNSCNAGSGCQINEECKCASGTCTCVPKAVVPPTASKCQTNIIFDVKTCGSTTSPCSGTP